MSQKVQYVLSSKIPPNQKILPLPYKFKCRDYQIGPWKALEKDFSRAVLCWHRGCGKDLFALNWLITRAIEKPGVYLHCFPNFNQAKRAIWKSVHNTHTDESMAYLDHFPEEIVKRKNSSDMMIELINGSIYCVMGIDGKNAIRARGMNPQDVILSEYAFMDPESWHTIEPRVRQNHGKALFISTPNGKNHFYELFNYAKNDTQNYFSSFLTISDTKTLSEKDIEQIRSEGVPEDFIQQEYFCSFERGAQGSYYGKLIQKARDDGRICDLPVIPDLPVHSSWDLGIRDSTSIWLFQVLRNGNIHFIHYYENQGEGLEHYIKYLNNYKSQKDIEWGKHFVPHDAKQRELISGIDRILAAAEFGYKFHVVPNHRIEEGIQAVRSTLPLCFFNERDCNYGIKCLDFYCKKWNESLKVYSDEPLHNKWSHGSDSARYACVGLRTLGVYENESMEAEGEALRRFWGG